MNSQQPGPDLSVHSSARAMAAAVRERRISARELLELHLARIEERNPELNAVVTLDAERARAGAAAADAREEYGALGAGRGETLRRRVQALL